MKSIAIIDDDVVFLKVIQILLKNFPAKITLLTSAHDFIELTETQGVKFDIVIVDIGMPIMSGYQLITYMNTKLAIYKGIKFIVLTGRDIETLKICNNNLDISRVQKPIDGDNLIEILKAI